jgi:hypothetical protein
MVANLDAVRGVPLLTPKQVGQLFSCHPRTLRRREDLDGFPLPYKSGKGKGCRLYYIREEILAYMNRKARERNAGVPVQAEAESPGQAAGL